MNILVIMCDQLRFDALGCNGNPYVHTPNIDRLASKSVIFKSGYTQSPICAPARHSLATGKYPHRHGVTYNDRNPKPGIYTVAHALKPLGYRRLQSGNMHWKSKDDNGYDELWTCPKFDTTVLTPESYKRYEWEKEDITRRTTGGPSTRKKEEYWGYQVADAFSDTIEEVVEKKEKFLSWNCIVEPHPPYYSPTEYYRKIKQPDLPLPVEVPEGAAKPHSKIIEKQLDWSHLTDVEKRQIKAGYYGLIEMADYYVGLILDSVDRLNLWENTMIIFTSDHGDQMGDHKLYLKFVLREASVHIPYMIYCPGIEPGIRNQFVEHVDIFPTICDYAGAQIPDDLDGKSLRYILENDDTPEDWRTEIFTEISEDRMIRTDEWKLNVYDGEPGELYHLKDDPDELYNLIGIKEYEEILNGLVNRLNQKIR